MIAQRFSEPRADIFSGESVVGESDGLSARDDFEDQSKAAAGWKRVRAAEEARGAKLLAANWIR